MSRLIQSFKNKGVYGAVMLSVALTGCGANAQVAPGPRADGKPVAQWEQSGWGGGGFYWAAAFHPTKDGVIYMAGDVLGVYKSVDHGLNWRIINKGLTDYGVYSLAVDRANPDTVYAASEGGLYKSVDAGENWVLLPQTGRKELRITGERRLSQRAIAVDPTNGNIVYAASPSGKIYKSTDGGQKWATLYNGADPTSAGALRIQYGKVNNDYFGGWWLPITVPEGLRTADTVSFGFAFKGDGNLPQQSYVTLRNAAGVSYRSKNLNELFKIKEWRDVLLKSEDFVLDPEYLKKNPDAAKTISATPDLSTITRMDFNAIGPPTESQVASVGRIFFGVTRTADGKTATADKPILLTAREFTTNKTVQTYGNIRISELTPPSVLSVEVAIKSPSTVLAVSEDKGLLLSNDAGQTWNVAATPAKATAAVFDPANPKVIYAGVGNAGIGKSTDGGATWTALTSPTFDRNARFLELVVSPTNSQDIYAIASAGWTGYFYYSNDGGKTWGSSSKLATDPIGDPTLPEEESPMPMSAVTNLAINPSNPKQLFISANWRSCYSDDAGKTWTERVRGADISVVTDIRFSGNRVYASAMDEGTLMSENNGSQWRQLWPLKWTPEISGHNWRLAINRQNGVDRIISTVSPWDKYPPRTILSQDGGKSFKVVTEGLPDYIIRPNTMWGAGHPRALAVDPQNPQIVYLGIDGDAAEGKSGGGLFKSLDGGASWKQLPNQPGSRRMFYGLMVDPTNSKRIYWAALGTGGGIWRSEDSGESWKHVFNSEGWPFNLLVSRDGTVYSAGKSLWRSTDQGNTWTKLTNFSPGGMIMGMEEDPRDSKTMWISFDKGKGGVYKTTDGGTTWNEITANLPYIYPQLLRFNPATNELWAGGVGLYKIKQ